MTRTKFLLNLFLILGIVLLAACGGGGGGTDPPPPGGGAQVIGPAGGAKTSDDQKASVTIPAGALSEEKVITVEKASNPPSGNISDAYEFGPEGTTFSEPVTIQIAYDNASVPSGINASDLRLGKVVNGEWEAVSGSTVDTGLSEVSGTTSSFSVYGVIANTSSTAVSAISLAKTGQPHCYDSSGASSTRVNCTGTGQDGEMQKGVPWPIPRFTADATGSCMLDHLTGLMWVRSPDGTRRTWQGALDHANNLTICGFSDWRLPNVNEQESLMNTEAELAAWLNSQGFSNVQADIYWSSTSSAGNARNAWVVSLLDGSVNLNGKIFNGLVWPVRSG